MDKRELIKNRTRVKFRNGEYGFYSKEEDEFYIPEDYSRSHRRYIGNLMEGYDEDLLSYGIPQCDAFGNKNPDYPLYSERIEEYDIVEVYDYKTIYKAD